MSQHVVEDAAQDIEQEVSTAVPIRHQEISERGRELAQYIKDLYVSGAKLWTKNMFRDLEAELAKEPRPHAVMIRSMNGVLRRKQIPLEGDDLQFDNMGPLYVFPHFKIYQQMILDAEEETFELDPDEATEPWPMAINIDDEMALATRALTLARTDNISSSTEFVQLKAAWDETWRNWTQSAACSELTATLRSACIAKATRKLVCFGLGNLEGPMGHSSPDVLATCDGLPRRRAMTQHAAAKTLAAVLGEQLGTDPLPILAQDPAYSSAAKQLLIGVGIEVVGGLGSLAFTLVDEGTVVFSCSPNVPVKQVVADIARPAAMIWNRVTPAAEDKTQWTTELLNGNEVRCSPWSTDQDSPRTRKLVDDYDKYDFSTDHERFGDLVIYIRTD